MAATAGAAELLKLDLAGPKSRFMTRRMGKVLLFAALLVVPTLAFEITTDKASSGEATEASQQHLFLLPVQVLGADGKPLHGLLVHDLSLKVDGKPEPINELIEISAPVAAEPAHSSSANDAKRVYSNQPEGGMPQQLLIIAVDLINTGFIGKGEAEQQLLKYLMEGLPQRPFELVAITADGLVQIHSFDELPSPDSGFNDDVLKNDPAVNAMQAGLTASEYSELLKLIEAPRIHSPYSWEIAVRASLKALRQLAEAYAGIPGRKAVIWLTAGIRATGGDPNATARRRGGFQTYDKSPLTTDPQLRAAYDEAFRALNTSDMAVYPLDLKPISGRDIYLANSLGPVVGDGKDLNFTVGGFESNDGIKPLAAESGGRPCSIVNKLKTCIGEATDDAQSYYLLVFKVDPNEHKTGWHKLEVSTASAGSKVRTRSRFFVPTTAAPSTDEIHEYLRAIAKGQVEYTGLAFVLERLPDTREPGEGLINIRVRVPARSIVLAPGETKLSYDIAAVALSNTGETTHAVRLIPFDLSAEQTQATLLKGWRIDEQWPQLDSEVAIRYVIRDRATGRIGSVTIPLSKPTPPK